MLFHTDTLQIVKLYLYVYNRIYNIYIYTIILLNIVLIFKMILDLGVTFWFRHISPQVWRTCWMARSPSSWPEPARPGYPHLQRPHYTACTTTMWTSRSVRCSWPCGPRPRSSCCWNLRCWLRSWQMKRSAMNWKRMLKVSWATWCDGSISALVVPRWGWDG